MDVLPVIILHHKQGELFKTGAPFVVPGDINITGGHMATNPRYKNGNLRRKHRARFRAMDAPCGICKGRLGPIHYDEPSDSSHPLSFVIDEIKPISKYKQFGYESKAQAANDWNNLQAAHYCCNQAKGNKTETNVTKRIGTPIAQDGQW